MDRDEGFGIGLVKSGLVSGGDPFIIRIVDLDYAVRLRILVRGCPLRAETDFVVKNAGLCRPMFRERRISGGDLGQSPSDSAAFPRL
jgi:hypothetical protein